ncbi:MAG: hypothetical protein KY462_11445 [Actinobacteria bacterium]|nr:hypothetical protein [Actinomycetota bacterium]
MERQRPYASEYRDQVVEISRLAVNESVLEGITFANCTIVGPAVLVPLEGVSIVGGTWDAPNWEALSWIIPRNRDTVIGAIGVKDCTFSACRFQNVGLAVPEDEEERFREGFGG